MAAKDRFFVEAELVGGKQVDIGGVEAHHLARVMRVKKGELIEVFDGGGRVAEATVESVSRDMVCVSVADIENFEREEPQLVLATAIPKGKRWQNLVEKCTELGVSAIQPVIFSWSVAEGAGNPEKWRRWAVEACKQCRRAYIPEIYGPVSFDEYLKSCAGADTRLIIADPQGGSFGDISQELSAADAPISFLIGPEAGLTDEERESALAAGATPVRFGANILRIETACMAGCALVRANYRHNGGKGPHWLGECGPLESNLGFQD